MKDRSFVDYPPYFKVGSQRVEVRTIERCPDNALGRAVLAGGYVEIADTFDVGAAQSPDSKKNTFYHELVHVILENMGEHDLDKNEKFVTSFAGFLTEAMDGAKFMKEEDKQDE